MQDLDQIGKSLAYFTPELILLSGIVLLLVAGFFSRKNAVLSTLALLSLVGSLSTCVLQFDDLTKDVVLFNDMLHLERFTAFFKILLSTGGVLTILLSWIYFNTYPSGR